MVDVVEEWDGSVWFWKSHVAILDFAGEIINIASHLLRPTLFSFSYSIVKQHADNEFPHFSSFH